MAEREKCTPKVTFSSKAAGELRNLNSVVENQSPGKKVPQGKALLTTTTTRHPVFRLLKVTLPF